VKIRFGYELVYGVPQQTAMIFTLHSQPNCTQQLVRPDVIHTDPEIPLFFYPDAFGNTCTRLEAPAGILRIMADGIMEDGGLPEPAQWGATEYPVRDLPSDTLQYLLASRYCETDLLVNDAWRLFGHLAPGWARVQAICDFVNHDVTFGDLPRTTGRVPRSRAPGHRVLPMPQYSHALLHHILRGHRGAARRSTDGFRRMHGSVRRRCVACV